MLSVSWDTSLQLAKQYAQMPTSLWTAGYVAIAPEQPHQSVTNHGSRLSGIVMLWQVKLARTTRHVQFAENLRCVSDAQRRAPTQSPVQEGIVGAPRVVGP